MEAYLLDWANLLTRWLHLITGIAWVGASFYFVMLDNSIRPPKKQQDKDDGVHGELWAVHGGGFYHSQKYLTGPKHEPLTQNLHWSKWEAYTTWISGMGLLVLIYWFGATTYMIDPSVYELSAGGAIGISIIFLLGGWIIYDVLCSKFIGQDNLLAGLVFVLILIANFALFHLLSARAAFIHVGALMGTIMVANVYFHIIPGQRKMVAEIHAGQDPNPTPGIIGKQRSVHNTYFTLPVLFIMISNHYPMTYSSGYGWLILTLIMLAGVFIRQFFVLKHQGKVDWKLPAIGVGLLLAIIIALAPWGKATPEATSKIAYSQVSTIIQARCTLCHSATPTQPGFAQPPVGIMLDTEAQVRQHIDKVALTTGNKYMPLANLTKMTDDERTLIAQWVAQEKGHDH